MSETVWEERLLIRGYIRVNNYPLWWDTTITIYNKYIDPQTQLTRWYRTVIKNCFYKATGSSVVINQYKLDTGAIECRIPKQDNFKPRAEWLALPNDVRGNYFTVWAGDLIVPAEIEDEIDDYTDGKRATDFMVKMRNSYGCLPVDRASINQGRGRGQEHYYAQALNYRTENSYGT